MSDSTDHTINSKRSSGRGNNSNPSLQVDELQSINKRLAILEHEKQALLAQKAALERQLPSTTIATTFSTTERDTKFSTAEKVNIFRRLFVGREDVFAVRWENASGRSGYSVACHNEWKPGICNKPKIKCGECPSRKFKNLNQQAIYDHLSGAQTAGLYPLLPDNQCQLLAVDFDKSDWQLAAQSFSRACQEFVIPHAIERSRSGNGAHIWIFFSEKVSAKDARLLGFGLLDKVMEYHAGLSFDSYDRLFPNQDTMPEGGFGNLIALPLQYQPRKAGNSIFVDSNLSPFPEQWVFLSAVGRVSSDQLCYLIERVRPNSTPVEARQLKPWEQGLPIVHSKINGCPEALTITLANQVYIPLEELSSELPSMLTARLKRLASFANPVFFKTQALRFSTHGIPRYICCARIEQGYLAIPRGCLDEAIRLLEEQEIRIDFDDKRHDGNKLTKLRFLGELRKDQSKAVNALFKHDVGVLHAPTAFGKTVTAIGVIAKRKVNTLILTHSRQLLDQWKERLNAFVEGVNVGVVGGGTRKPSGEIDIATYQSLISRKDNGVDDILSNYGQIIIDECHHISAPRFEMLLNEVRAKYVLGLTATPERQDGHQRIIFMQAGPIRHKAKLNKPSEFEQHVVVRQIYQAPPLELIATDARPHIADVYRWLMESKDRNEHIIKDVISEIEKGCHPLVLTERCAHAEVLNQRLDDAGYKTQVLRGAMKVKERKAAMEGLENAQVLIATGKYIGEGFDLPRLDTLFLALPISWKGSLAQYAGRIHRQVDGKERVIIYDYVDTLLPMLERMFQRRSKGYAAMGYEQIEDSVQSSLNWQRS